MHHARRTTGGHRRRATILVKTAILLPVVFGFAAIGVDLTFLQAAQADLQRAADAAALAAAMRLATTATDSGRHAAVLTAAQDMVDHNPVCNARVELDAADLVLGQAAFDESTARLTWRGPTESNPNAVEVTLRRTTNSPSGALPLYFGRMIGHSTADLQATARATLLPRDIVFVCDLSGSMNDDSELRHHQTADINLRQIWEALGDGAGPTWARMTEWGVDPIGADYDPTTDPGLIHLPRGQAFSARAADELAAQGYTADEIAAMTAEAFDASGNQWRNRAAAVLGLAQWHSGMPGARFSGGGNGDAALSDREMSWSAYPFAGGSWSEYVRNYVSNGSTDMARANPAFRDHFGLKTFVNYVLERRPSFADTSVLWRTPELPLQPVKDAVGESIDILRAVDSGDQLSLVVYATTALLEVELTRDLSRLYDTLVQRQANHYDETTCIGCGLALARQELASGRGRSGAAKVIVLVTDGKANVGAEGEDDHGGGRDFAVAESQAAADDGIKIYTIGVGAEADVDLLADMAEIGGGSSFHAAGAVAEYTNELHDIFRTIGGRRPAVLIR